jgi:hypothetical protein
MQWCQALDVPPLHPLPNSLRPPIDIGQQQGWTGPKHLSLMLGNYGTGRSHRECVLVTIAIIEGVVIQAICLSIRERAITMT